VDQQFGQENKRTTPYNSRFAKAGVSCFYDSEVLNSIIVHLIKFSAEKPRLRQYPKRCPEIVNFPNKQKNTAQTHASLCVILKKQTTKSKK
jgi:hypothetical protein